MLVLVDLRVPGSGGAVVQVVYDGMAHAARVIPRFTGTVRAKATSRETHPRVAMQILRHSQIAVTMDIYSQVTSAATADALKRLGEQLGDDEEAS